MTPTATIALEVPDLEGLDRASDLELIEWTRRWGEARRLSDAGLSRLAAEVKRRSSLELGHDGLAQRSGMRGPDALVSSLTGTSGAEARAMVTVGEMMDSPSPWLAEVANGVGNGDVSVGAAAAIQQGLGSPSANVAADDLADAAHSLVAEAAFLPPEKVARRARELRDQLDADGVADREALLRDKRFLRLTPLPDGMTRLSGLLDPESAALVTDAIDLVTAPRRGGPRFVDPTQKTRADAIVNDSRTTEQLTLDAVVEMIRIAGSADEGRIFGTRKPGVRVHVTIADLDRRSGAAHVEVRARPCRSRPSSGEPVPTGTCRSSSTTAAEPSTSDARNASSQRSSASSSPPYGVDVRSPDAIDRHRGPKRITPTNGNDTTDPPT